MIFVEFVGLPASGKTTIANGVFSNLTEEAIYPLKQLYEKNWFIRNLHKSRAVIFLV